jgi:hypothetical protein
MELGLWDEIKIGVFTSRIASLNLYQVIDQEFAEEE